MKWIAISLLAIFIWGCSKETPGTPVTEKVEVKVPDGLFTEESPANPKSVTETRKLKAGDKVTVEGKVIGSKHPFIDGRALFVIGDPEKLKSCDLRPEDDCKTPWDVCCESTKDITAGTLSVQVVDADGKIVKTGLKGVNGLDNLSQVVIQGTVAENSTETAMTVTAEKIFIKK